MWSCWLADHDSCPGILGIPPFEQLHRRRDVIATASKLGGYCTDRNKRCIFSTEPMSAWLKSRRGCVTCTPRMPKMKKKKAQQMRMMFPMGGSEAVRASTASFSSRDNCVSHRAFRVLFHASPWQWGHDLAGGRRESCGQTRCERSHAGNRHGT